MKPEADSVQAALGQKRPLRSIGQEGVLALMLAAEVVRRRFELLLESGGHVTLQQYNVLRILRGAGEEGLPTLAIAERMIEAAPGITRLIDRLEDKGLVRRERSEGDRRQVLCRLTPKGGRLLADLEDDVDELDDVSLDCLSKTELETLIRLLNRVRRHVPKG